MSSIIESKGIGMLISRQWIFALMIVVYLCNLAVDANAYQAKQAIADEISYTNDIRPIIDNYCTTCHAGDDPA